MKRLPTEEGRVWSGKVVEERICAAAAVETAPLSLLLPLPFGVRGTKGLTSFQSLCGGDLPVAGRIVFVPANLKQLHLPENCAWKLSWAWLPWRLASPQAISLGETVLASFAYENLGFT